MIISIEINQFHEKLTVIKSDSKFLLLSHMKSRIEYFQIISRVLHYQIDQRMSKIKEVN
jgi:hypothetical protein